MKVSKLHFSQGKHHLPIDNACTLFAIVTPAYIISSVTTAASVAMTMKINYSKAFQYDYVQGVSMKFYDIRSVYSSRYIMHVLRNFHSSLVACPKQQNCIHSLHTQQAHRAILMFCLLEAMQNDKRLLIVAFTMQNATDRNGL